MWFMRIFFMECICNFGDVILYDFIAFKVDLYISFCNHDMDIFCVVSTRNKYTTIQNNTSMRSPTESIQ